MIISSRHLLSVGTLLACIATAGSLYFSEVMGFHPCGLCWFQRIFMYPLVIVFGVALYENRSEVYRTALPFASVGLTLSTYHSLLQRTTLGGGTCARFSCDI